MGHREKPGTRPIRYCAMRLGMWEMQFDQLKRRDAKLWRSVCSVTPFLIGRLMSSVAPISALSGKFVVVRFDGERFRRRAIAFFGSPRRVMLGKYAKMGSGAGHTFRCLRGVTGGPRCACPPRTRPRCSRAACDRWRPWYRSCDSR
jgi:hypothetical protein